MREIKFDIKIRHIETGNTFREIMTLDEIMTSGKLYTKGIQEVVYIRQFTGHLDKNKTPIYDKDICMFEIKGLGKGKANVYLFAGCFFLKVDGQEQPFPLFEYEFRDDIIIEVLVDEFENP